MKIDPEIEDPLRNCFAAVVDQDAGGLVAPLEALTEEQARQAGTYAMFVVNFVMHDVYDDPDSDAAGLMAKEAVADISKWMELGPEAEASAFLLACANWDASFPGVEADRVAVYAFVLGGYLLSHFRPEGMRWFEYLDMIWNFAEQQSAT